MNTSSCLLLLLILSFTTANPNDEGGQLNNKCHNSCATCIENICKSCTIPNTHVDPLKRACVCYNDYYAESLNPLVCEKKISGNEEERCEKDIAQNIGDFLVNTLCYYETQANIKNFVISEVTIDTDHCFFDNSDCRKKLVTEIQYRPKGNNQQKEDKQYIHFPDKYVSNLVGGKAGDKKIKIPLIDVYDLSFTASTISNDKSQIVQQIYFRIMIGFTRKFVRAHKWIMTVYTNRNEIQTFIIDVDIQRTESCQDGQECIIIADLDVTGNQYTQNWGTIRPTNKYIVGDWMYMKIWFKDTTYTKQLSFQKLYLKNEEGQVFDHTLLVDKPQSVWNTGDKSLHVKLRLIEPGQNSVVQVNMLIETLNAHLRSLQVGEQTISQQQFRIEVLSDPKTPSSSAKSFKGEQSNSFIIFFGLINFFVGVFFF